MSCTWCGSEHSALESCAEMLLGEPLEVVPPERAEPPPSVVAQVGRWLRHAAAIVAGTVRR